MCIIIASRFKDGVMLAKNRDRSYTPKISFVHEIVDNTEILYMKDNDTGWIEGLNQHGIGLINSALMVGHDEKEKKIVKKTGKPSKDAPQIKKALSKKNLQEIISFFEDDKKKAVKGHTFFASGKEDKAYRIEVTSRHDFVLKELNLDEITVRTNHGFEYPDSGYTKGVDYKSSIYRKAQAEKGLKKSMNPDQIMRALRKKNYSKKSGLNMNRDTSMMRTTGQIVLDLDNKKMWYNAMNGKSELIEYEKSLPEGYKPKLKLELIKDDVDTLLIKESEGYYLMSGQEIISESGEKFLTTAGDIIL